MFERYREDARRAIYFARWEAQQSGSPYIEEEHIFLGLTHDADSKANQLFALSIHAENLRTQSAAQTSIKSSTSVDLPLSNPSKRVLAHAAEEADRLGSKPIGTEHLLLGLLRENKSSVPETLATAGIDLRSARNRIRQELRLPIPEREPELKETAPKSLRLIATPLLLIVVLALVYLIFRLVSS
jgi:ATP-dependent Clp protease ATP-binding subunit ClpC